MGVSLVVRASSFAGIFSGGGGGAIGDGDIVAFTGPAVTKPAIEFPGGPSGTIATASVGTVFAGLRPGWSDLVTFSRRPTISSERFLNRPHSIICDTRGTDEYKQTLFYDVGAGGYKSLYKSCWYYLDHDTLPSGYLQWKVDRFCRLQTVVDGNDNQTYMTNRRNVAGFMNWFNNGGANNFNMWWDDPGMTQLPGRGAWYRYETWLRYNSAPGAADGYFRIKVTDTTGAVVADNVRSNITYLSAGDTTNPYRWVVLQQYTGNADVGQPPGAGNGNANAVIWMDDLYISTSPTNSGENIRAELCDSATYASATKRTICEITGIVGTTWSARMNKGVHTPVDLRGLWMHLFNSNESTTVIQV